MQWALFALTVFPRPCKTRRGCSPAVWWQENMRKVSAFGLAAAFTVTHLAAAQEAPAEKPAQAPAEAPVAPAETSAAAAPATGSPPAESPAPTGADAPADPVGTEDSVAGDAEATSAAPARAEVELTPSFPDPSADARALEAQGDSRPGQTKKEEEAAGSRSGTPLSAESIFAEDWWSHTRPIFELHGLFRTRSELFADFSLNRIDAPDSALWARPSGSYYESNGAAYGPSLCTGDGQPNNDGSGLSTCGTGTQAGANLSFILRPELHVSDNLRVKSEFRFFNNLRLGSNPAGYAFGPSAGGGYETTQPAGYYQNGIASDTQTSPISGVNSIEDAIQVTMAWGEYTTPVGELRFGRMPHQWGMGMLYNSGQSYDADFWSSVDRLTFVTGLKPLDLVAAISWDFPNEGPGGTQPLALSPEYDLTQKDDVNQFSLTLMRKLTPELTESVLAKGNVVLNVGSYMIYRDQELANDIVGDATAGANVPNASREQLAGGFSRRGAQMFVPDLWVQVLYKKFRFETEAALVVGKIDSTNTVPDNRGDFRTDDARRDLLQFGFTTEFEQLLLEDKLHLEFNSGYATGDASAFDPDTVGDLVPGPNETQVADKNITTFRFNPNYQVDLILHRYLLQRVQGTYYFRPSVAYDFIRDVAGQRAGGRAAAIWTRASERLQTPGHDYDLGIELNATLYYQSNDGALNDDPDEMGGFYTMVQYGVLFPLGGLGYQAREAQDLGNPGTTAAQIVRWYLGVLF